MPAPEVCRFIDLDLRPGDSFRTELNQGDGSFGPHITGCLLAVDDQQRIVFTAALVADWRPSEASFVTAVITMGDRSEDTGYGDRTS